MGYSLRDYQEESLEVINNFEKGVPGLIVHPTRIWERSFAIIYSS